MDISLFYDILQVALKGPIILSCTPKEEDWKQLFVLAQKQAVTGLAFESLEKLSKVGFKPPIDILYEWIGVAQQIKVQNVLVNKRCCEITEMFTKAGFRSCILKGQGNALMYANPMSRISGDIDIWIDAPRKEIRDFVLSKCPKAQDGHMHIDFPVYDDVQVEVHYKPRYDIRPKYDKRLQTWIKEHSEEQFNNWVTLPETDEGRICVPTTEFNVIHQMSHIMGHFFIEGIGLRQFIDYYYLLKKYHDEGGNTTGISETLDYLGLLKFAGGVMYVLRDTLALPEKYLITEPDEKIGRRLLKELEEGGNFGYHDHRYSLRNKGYIARGLTDIYRLLKLTPSFPDVTLWKILGKFANQKWKI